MDVDVARGADDPVDDRAACELGPARLARRTEDELARVLGAGELDERGRDVGAGHLGVAAAELAEESVLVFEALGVRAGESVRGTYVDAHELTADAGGHARAAPQEAVAVRGAGDRHDHSFLGLPRLR